MKFSPNHTAPYFGSGYHEIIQAAGLQIHKSKLDIYLTKRFKVLVLQYPKMTVEQLSKMKSHAYSRVGKLYDFAGIASFILPFIKEIPWADYCVELSADSLTAAKIIDEIKKMTPRQFLALLKKAGFKVCYVWDKGTTGDNLKDIPAGAICFVEGWGIFAQLIKAFSRRLSKLYNEFTRLIYNDPAR